MTMEQLNKEIKKANEAYQAEKRKNHNQDGTVLGLILKSRLEMLDDLKLKYYI